MKLDALALAAVLASYSLGFFLFPPRLALVYDEAQYIRQAKAFAEGQKQILVRDPLTWELRSESPSPYPAGVSLLQTPFVFLGGWRFAACASLLSLVATVVLLGAWLRSQGQSRLFALLFLLYPPVLVLARTGMSDVPSAAVVTAGLWVFLQGPKRSWAWPVAGLIAGVSTTFRDSNPIFFVVFVASTLRTRLWPLAFLAGLGGLALRPLLGAWLQGNALIGRTPEVWTLVGFGPRLGLYLWAEMVLVPGGLVAVSMYRGKYRWQVVGTVAVVTLFFAAYSYAGQYSGGLRQWILGPRYIIPLVPLLAIAVAEASNRLYPRASAWLSSSKRSLVAVPVLIACVIAFAVHPLMASWSKAQESIVTQLYRNTDARTVLIGERGAVSKYLNELYGDRAFIGRDELPVDALVELRRLRRLELVFLDRTDSQYWREVTRANQSYISAVASRCELKTVVDFQASEQERLRIWDVQRCS